MGWGWCVSVWKGTRHFVWPTVELSCDVSAAVTYVYILIWFLYFILVGNNQRRRAAHINYSAISSNGTALTAPLQHHPPLLVHHPP